MIYLYGFLIWWVGVVFALISMKLFYKATDYGFGIDNFDIFVSMLSWFFVAFIVIISLIMVIVKIIGILFDDILLLNKIKDKLNDW